MILPRTVKATSRPRSVGVIFSASDLQRAVRLRKPPDLFELRLDSLLAAVHELPDIIAQLRAQFIITARSPAEGGVNKLSVARRRELLTRFLPHATFLDVELASATALSSLLENVRAKNVRLILSLHDLSGMPALADLYTAALRAKSLGADIFKVAARTDHPDQLRNLIQLVQLRASPIPISAMGLGKLGRVSRTLLVDAGSVLNYAHLGIPTVEGQWSLTQLRAAMRLK